MLCVVCQKVNGFQMTDGRTTHAVCDECRAMVNMFFFTHGSLSVAVSEAAQVKRGVHGR